MSDLGFLNGVTKADYLSTLSARFTGWTLMKFEDSSKGNVDIP